MRFTLHATHRTPHGASQSLVQICNVFLVGENRSCSASRQCRDDARVYGYNTTGMHGIEYTTLPPAHPRVFVICVYDNRKVGSASVPYRVIIGGRCNWRSSQIILCGVENLYSARGEVSFHVLVVLIVRRPRGSYIVTPLLTPGSGHTGKQINFFEHCHPYARKSASQAVLSRMQLSLHATHRKPHGASSLVLAMSAWSVKSRRAPSQHCRDARVYGHATTAMHDIE